MDGLEQTTLKTPENVKHLWHGTGELDPQRIMAQASEGLDCNKI